MRDGASLRSPKARALTPEMAIGSADAGRGGRCASEVPGGATGRPFPIRDSAVGLGRSLVRGCTSEGVARPRVRYRGAVRTKFV